MDVNKLLYEIGLARVDSLDAKEFILAKLLEEVLEFIEAQESIIYDLENEKYRLQSENTVLKLELEDRRR